MTTKQPQSHAEDSFQVYLDEQGLLNGYKNLSPIGNQKFNGAAFQGLHLQNYERVQKLMPTNASDEGTFYDEIFEIDTP